MLLHRHPVQGALLAGLVSLGVPKNGFWGTAASLTRTVQTLLTSLETCASTSRSPKDPRVSLGGPERWLGPLYVYCKLVVERRSMRAKKNNENSDNLMNINKNIAKLGWILSEISAKNSATLLSPRISAINLCRNQKFGGIRTLIERFEQLWLYRLPLGGCRPLNLNSL